MKAKFTVSHAEMTIYKSALKDELIVTMKGVEGKHVMNSLKVKEISADEYELSIEYGKVEKRGKRE